MTCLGCGEVDGVQGENRGQHDGLACGAGHDTGVRPGGGSHCVLLLCCYRGVFLILVGHNSLVVVVASQCFVIFTPLSLRSVHAL